jgi:mono/diheme cytochrome c family protein
MSRRSLTIPAALLATALLLVACGQKMGDQPTYRPLEQSQFFGDDTSAQQLVPSVVPREADTDEALTTGKTGSNFISTIPLDVTDDLVRRGSERFVIFCVPCHGQTAAGDGTVVQHGFPQPPALTIQRLRDEPVGQLFETITSGTGRMPAYGPQVPPRDRWAIVAYLRTLQSQGAPAVSQPASPTPRTQP